MTIQIYNSLTKQKEPLRTLEPSTVKMYVCGMTVYDYCHIGHVRMLLAFDMIARYFRHSGYDVTYVRNITDIDDKIIVRANENGESIENLTERFIKAMHEDEAALSILRPDIEPRATHHIEEIITLIEKLIDNGIAYPADNGDVYYQVNKFEDYGKLSNKSLDELQAGARVEVDEHKLSPLDFVLWKSSKPGEPAWDSPWGKGRPGWHIECSAMSMKCLGETFDIHGGGFDLQFPHHENEIAQSEAATGKPFVSQWIHNGFVQVNKEKMSKSLGNFFTVRDVLELYQPEVIRFFILASQYRSPLNYSEDNLNAAKNSLTTIYTALRGKAIAAIDTLANSNYEQAFVAAMNDDFNTPEAFAVLFNLVHDINKTDDLAEQNQLATHLVKLGAILGLFQDSPEHFLQGEDHDEDEVTQIENLIKERNDARANKNWVKADQVRDQLLDMGVTLEDGAGGTTWRKA